MDWLDRVQEASEVYQAAALRSHLNRRKLEPVPEGNAGEKRRCIDCEEIIPRARIEANSKAVRCVPCQIKYEREGDT